MFEEPPNKKFKLSKPMMFDEIKVTFEEEVAEYLKQHYGKEHFENICKSLTYLLFFRFFYKI